VRKFLLDHSATILQDDSGVPLAYFNRQGWQVRPFGRYAGPLSIFPGAYQSNMTELFRNATPINFGIGYRWRNNESNLLLAQKSGASASEEVATPNSLSETAAPGTTNQPTKKTRKRVQRNATGSLGCREGGFFPVPFEFGRAAQLVNRRVAGRRGAIRQRSVSHPRSSNSSEGEIAAVLYRCDD
jgi:hypothetical protein